MKKLYWKLWIEYWCLKAWLKGAGKDKNKGINDSVNGLEDFLEDHGNLAIIGDSSANHLAQRLKPYKRITNYARNGSTIDDFSKPIVGRFNTIIIMIGGNNIGLLNEDAIMIAFKHFDLYKRIQADRKIVIGLSPVNGTEGFAPYKNEIIKEVNQRLEAIYDKEFISTFPKDMLPSFTDGVHHAWHYDLQIINKLLEKL